MNGAQSFKNSFPWPTGPNRTVFPIDYTENEFAKAFFPRAGTKKGKQALEGDRSFVKRLTNQMWFRRIREMLTINENYKKTKPTFEEASSRTAPITCPIEAVPVLIQFLQTIQSQDAYKRRFPDEYEKKSDPISADLQESFLHDLFCSLHEEVMSGTYSDGFPPEAHDFYAAALYENPDFASRITNDLWKTLVRERLNQLISLAKDISPSAQIGVLVDCLKFLDRGISRLQQEPNNHTQVQENYTDILLQLMTDLTAMRKPQNGTRAYITYEVENYTEGEKAGLETLFKKLDRSTVRDEQELYRGRELYLNSLRQKAKNSEFLTTCRTLHRYMDAFHTEVNSEQLREEVEKRMLQHFKPIFDHMNNAPGNTPDPMAPSFVALGYCSEVLETWITDLARDVSIQFEPARYLVVFHQGSAISEMIAIEKMTKIINLFMPNSVSPEVQERLRREVQTGIFIDKKEAKDRSSAFFTNFLAMWQFAYKGVPGKDGILPVGRALSPDEIDRISTILSEDCCRAAPDFGIRVDTGDYTYKVDTLRAYFDHYNNAAFATQDNDMLLSTFIPSLLKAISIVVLKTTIERESPRFVNDFLRLQELYRA